MQEDEELELEVVVVPPLSPPPPPQPVSISASASTSRLIPNESQSSSNPSSFGSGSELGSRMNSNWSSSSGSGSGDDSSASDSQTGERASTFGVPGPSSGMAASGSNGSIPASGSASGSGNGPSGTKTPRKNVQWAASTKGEGPMNAVAEAHTYLREMSRRDVHVDTTQDRGRGRDKADVVSRGRERERDADTGKEREEGHVHLLDEEGRDPKAFQTLTHALERHQSSSHVNSPSTYPNSHIHPRSPQSTVGRDSAASGSHPRPPAGMGTGIGSEDRSSGKGTNIKEGSIAADAGASSEKSNSNSDNLNSRPEFRQRRTEPPRLTSLPPNPFSPTSGSSGNFNNNNNNKATNKYNSSYNHNNKSKSEGRESNMFNEIFTPTTLSPIHSDAETETEGNTTPERSMPGEAFIESTETAGLPQHLSPSAAAAADADSAGAGTSEGGRFGLGGRFNFFPFRSGSTNKDDLSPSGAPASGGGDTYALRTMNAVDAEEEEKRRVERRATKLVRAHARGFQFLAGFKGNKALQRLAPEDIDPEAPLPRRPTRFSKSTAGPGRSFRRRRRPQSAPVPAKSADQSRDSSPDKADQPGQEPEPEPEQQQQRSSERYGLFSMFRSRQSPSQERDRDRSFDEDVEDTAAIQAQRKNAPLALGSGVLSALLTLYDRPASGLRSGLSTPGDRTPSGSEPASPESDSVGHGHAYGYGQSGGYGKRREKEREKGKDEKGDYFGKQASRRERERNRGAAEDEHESHAQRQMDELQRINTRLNASNIFDSEQERDRFEREKESERKLESVGTSSGELTPPHPLYARKSGSRSLQSLKIRDSFSELTRTMSGSMERIREKTSPTRLAALPLPRIPLLGVDSLPAGARSGAGVFGSLIASTNNLTGIAAPGPSRIAPNPKKPGFHLNRYSWSEETTDADVDVLKRAKKAVASGFRTPGGSSRSSLAMSRSDIGLSSWAAAAAAGTGAGWSGTLTPSESLLALGMSKSAPTTPAGEIPPSLVVPPGLGGTPSPASSGSPASITPLIGASSRNYFDSPVTPGAGHSPSRSLDGATLLGGDRPFGSRHARAQSDTLSLTTIPTRGSAATSTTLNGGGLTMPGRRKWTGILKDFQQKHSSGGGDRSGAATPDTMSETGSHDYWDEKHRRWVLNTPGTSSSAAEEKRKRKRKKAEIFITRHVAEIMQRQEFIMKLTRAFMMFGAPSHRLPAQIQATARVLELELSCMYLPDVMLISFDDAATSTSNIKFIRQGAALSLGKLQKAYNLYWKVIHDEVGVGEASRALDALMQQRPPYSTWQLALFGGFCSASICQLSFSGSFIDSLIAFPLGVLLVFVQILSVRNELYSNVFEITITTLLSFLAAVFAGTHHFCYSAVASGSIVLILPGFLVLNGSLELSSRNMVSGAVRLCYAVMYSLFLGFGLSIGGTLYEKVTDKSVASPEDYTCSNSHSGTGPWYQRTPNEAWAFLTVPMFSLFLSLRNQAPWWKKELIVTVVISCIGWTCNHFSALKFPNRSDVSSAIGAFSVGFIANLYGRFFSGNAFVIMITGILFQLPSGLGNGGLITFASQNNTTGTSTSYLSGFKTALQLISVSVGLTVGLGISLVVLYPIQSRKRAGGIFSL